MLKGTYREAWEGMDRDCKRNRKEEDEKELKLNFIQLPESVGRGVTAGENLNLGERKNNLKRKRKKESRGEANKRKKKKRERHDGSPPFKSAFSPFCGLSEKGFPEISP